MTWLVGCSLLPAQSADLFFLRCMADSGYPDVSVEVENNALRTVSSPEAGRRRSKRPCSGATWS